MQYVFLRPLLTVAAVLCHYQNIYCPESLNWKHTRLYITCVGFTSVTIALYGLVTFYVTVREELEPYKPFNKFLSVKLVLPTFV